MKSTAKNTINIQGVEIRLDLQERGNYYSLTDLAQGGEGEVSEVIRRWMRAQKTIDFLGVWEKVHNPAFNLSQMGQIKLNLSVESFYISVKKWVQLTGAIGLEARAGRYGGTYAHADIALHFANWLSPEFYVHLIKEFQRLKTDESTRLGLDWNLKRQLAKANWYIHTEAVREHLVPIIDWNTRREAYAQASEADLLNLSLFGRTAREWKAANPEASGNLRDHATTEQLLVLANLQSLNAKLLEWDSPKEQRLEILNKTAREQMEILVNTKAVSNLKQLGNSGTNLIDS